MNRWPLRTSATKPATRAAILRRCGAALLLGLGTTATSWAASLALVGSFTDRAVLVLDGGAPMVLRMGERRQGVELLTLRGELAEVRYEGQLLRLRLGDTPVSVQAGGSAGANLNNLKNSAGSTTMASAKLLAAPQPGSTNAASGYAAMQSTPGSVRLEASADGHFYARISIGGKPLETVVDTGASSLVLSERQAMQLGLKLDGAELANMHTANGTVPVAHIVVPEVMLGDIRVRQVTAVITDNNLPTALLGMSFLSQLRMHREKSVMTLSSLP